MGLRLSAMSRSRRAKRCPEVERLAMIVQSRNRDRTRGIILQQMNQYRRPSLPTERVPKFSAAATRLGMRAAVLSAVAAALLTLAAWTSVARAQDSPKLPDPSEVVKIHSLKLDA